LLASFRVFAHEPQHSMVMTHMAMAAAEDSTMIMTGFLSLGLLSGEAMTGLRSG
jgi:hypothetical protein